MSGLLLAARREPQDFSSGRAISAPVERGTSPCGAFMPRCNASCRQPMRLHQSQQVRHATGTAAALGQMASVSCTTSTNPSHYHALRRILAGSETTVQCPDRGVSHHRPAGCSDVARTDGAAAGIYRQPLAHQRHGQGSESHQWISTGAVGWRSGATTEQRLGVTIYGAHRTAGGGTPRYCGVRVELREALINLIFNAWMLCPRGTFTLQDASAYRLQWSLEVIDTGIGMDETTRQRCLERSTRPKTARGTGLGSLWCMG